MTYCEWKEEYSVGIRLIDDEHRELVELIDELESASRTLDNQATLRHVLAELQRYVITHFTVEEELMRLYEFPGFEHHKKIHDAFRDKINTIAEHFSEGEIEIVSPLMHLLKDWLTSHILTQDRQIGMHLAKKGLR